MRRVRARQTTQQRILPAIAARFALLRSSTSTRSPLCGYHSALPAVLPPTRPIMRPLFIAAALLPALLLAVPAHAARWQVIKGKAANAPMRSEVDAASLTPVGEGSVRVWHREIYRKPVIPESGAFSFTRLTLQTEFQCAKRTAALVQRSYTAADGTELKSESFEALERQPIVPDSDLETVFGYACRNAGTARAGAKPAAKPEAPSSPEPSAATAQSAAPGQPAAAPSATTAAAAPAAAAPATPPESTTKPRKPGKKTSDEPHHPPHWSYSGATGPEQWGALDAQFATCASGQRQSPIDIRRTVLADLPPIRFDYHAVPLSIVDNGHSIKVDTPGAGGISVDGEDYALQQFHFHKPSEEKINGKAYDLVAHLVHQSASGKLAVVAVLFEAGKEQALLRTLWTHLPLETDKPVLRPEVKINPLDLLPAKRGYYTFLGSLTTPPCSEGVLWLVLKSPVQVSKEQLAGFATIYKNNVRPVQPVNGRLIKESR
jgi:carbonic anhydrase